MEACSRAGFGPELAPRKRAKFQDISEITPWSKTVSFSVPRTKSLADVSPLEQTLLAIDADEIVERTNRPRVVQSTPRSREPPVPFLWDRRTTTTTSDLILQGPSTNELRQKRQKRLADLAQQSRPSGDDSSAQSASSASCSRKRKSSDAPPSSLGQLALTSAQIREALDADRRQCDPVKDRRDCAIILCSSEDRRTATLKDAPLPCDGCRHKGCGRRIKARGLCPRHYIRALRFLKKNPGAEVFS